MSGVRYLSNSVLQMIPGCTGNQAPPIYIGNTHVLVITTSISISSITRQNIMMFAD